MSDQIVSEHFWFTATTLGLNAFLISADPSPSTAWWARACSTAVSAYAVFLIVHRSAAHAGKLADLYPEDLRALSESQKEFWHKGRETWAHLKIFPRHLLFVVFEFNGALFYVSLVVLSCLGVWRFN
jgi:hypothetical protein